MYEESLCDCGECKYCIAHGSSDYDYETADFVCVRCNGAGCSKCEE